MVAPEAGARGLTNKACALILCRVVSESRSDAAKRQMIDAAERLVAERGLASVSAREVLEAAGQRNKAAISYHFGTWDDLIEAVLATRMAEVAGRRQGLLDALDSGGGAATTRELVEALILPFAERCISDASSRWARFLYRCMSDPHIVTIVERSVEGQSFRDADERLVEHLTQLPDPLRRRRVQRAFATAVGSLADFETRRDSTDGPTLGIEIVLSDLVDVAVAIVDQPPSAGTRELLDRIRTTQTS